MTLKTATIRARLVASFSVMTIFILAIGWLGISGRDRIKRLEAETALVRAGVQAQRHQAKQNMADGFERIVGGIVDSVGRAACETRRTAQATSGTANETARQRVFVAAAAEQAASNVETVAAASEEPSSCVQEIGRRMQDTAELAGAAVREAGTTEDPVKKLNATTAHIGDVVNFTGVAGAAEETGTTVAQVLASASDLLHQSAHLGPEVERFLAGVRAT